MNRVNTRPKWDFYVQKPMKSTAIEYYRVEVPVRVLRDKKLATVFVEDHSHLESKEDLEMCLPIMAGADFHIYLNRPTQGLMDRVQELRALRPGRTAPYGEVKHPPKIFWSIDDNYHWVHPLNPAFLYNGYRLPNGRELGKEDLWLELGDGKKEKVWTYGHQYGPKKFDPPQNRRDIRRMDEFLRSNAHGVMFTTDRLRDYYRDDLEYPETYVFPNCIYFQDYEKLYRDGHWVRSDKSRVKVLWQGGASHFLDLASIRKSMMGLTKRLPEIVWMIWGTQFNWISKEIADENVEFVPWVPYEAYKPMLSTLDFDFALAPLVDNPFNQAKSGIKVYEAAVLPKPRPTLAANVPPYSDEFVDGETAVLYDPKDPKDFEDKFERLVKDPDFRDKVAVNCRDWIREHRNAETEAPKLLEWMASLRGEKRTAPKEMDSLMKRVRERGLMAAHEADAFI